MQATHLKKARKARRTQAQLFVDKLSKLSSGTEKPISNKALWDSLGWDEARYKRVRSELASQKKIHKGGGPGGTVALVNPPGTKGLSLFLSYSHKDESFKNDLLKHIEPLKKSKLIQVWHDGQISPGDEWNKEIYSNLRKADIVLLLVSIDFINSTYCFEIELEQALDRHEAKKARVIPVIVRTCMWRNTPLAKLQALPKDGKAATLLPDRDEVLMNIAEDLRKVAEELLKSR